MVAPRLCAAVSSSTEDGFHFPAGSRNTGKSDSEENLARSSGTNLANDSVSLVM